MSNDYLTSLLVRDRLAEFRREAEQDRLVREARAGRPSRRWWERLMLFRTRVVTGTRAAAGTHRPAATVAAGNSPC